MSEALKLLIHAAEPAALTRARSNASNFIAARPAAMIEIVVNAQAVAAALADPHPTDRYLRLCGNTLRNNRLTAPETFVVVEAAVVHIAERQSDGWAYMRA